MRIAFVSLPKIDDRFIITEDCCIGRTTNRPISGLMLACASEAKRSGHTALFLDASIESVDVSGCDLVVFPQSWIYHENINAQMSRMCGNVPFAVISIPGGYSEDFAAMKPKPAFVLSYNPEFSIPTIDLANGTIERVQDVRFSELGSLDYSLIPKRYWRHYVTSIYQVTRGCPYRCQFCTWGGSTVNNPNFGIKNPEIVATDLQTLKRTKPSIALNLLCSQLTTNARWLTEFERLVRGNVKTYTSNVNLSEVTSDKIRLLARSGCLEVSAGMEGASDSILKRIGKSSSFDDLLRGISVLSKNKMPFKLHFRFGFGETDTEIDEQQKNFAEIAKVVKGGRFNRFTFGPLIHYKGTHLYDNCDCDLIPHPESNLSLIRSDIPWGRWIEFAVRIKRLGLGMSFSKVPNKWTALYRKTR